MSEEKTGFSSKVQDAIVKIRELLNAIYIGEKSFSTISGKLINAVKVFIVSTRKFLDDDCLTKSSSIAYTIMVSLIPTLTVALTIYSVFSGVAGQKDELFRKISVFMIDHNLKLNIDPIFSAISDVIDNAGKIGGIGAAAMIFSATAMLRTLEKSLNEIYKVQKHRSMVMKIIFYWAALTLGPIIIISATTVATQLSETLSSPNLNSAQIVGNKIWLAGNKATLKSAETTNLQFTPVTGDDVDFDNQKMFAFNKDESKFELLSDDKLDLLEFMKVKLKDVQFIGKEGWVVGNEGIVLETSDGGKKWQLKKLDKFNFNAIRMINTKTGFIAGDNGLLLKTDDGGTSWNIVKFEDMIVNFTTISFKGKYGIVTGSRGTIASTEDSGKTWAISVVKETKKAERFLNINNAYILDNDDMVLIGDEGMILKSSNGGKSWESKKFKQNNYHTVYFFDGKKGVVAGDKGTMIFTDDGGESWYVKALPTQRVNRLLYSSKTLWAVGDTGMIMHSTDNGLKWKGIEGESLIAFLINFFAPFIFIWVLFLLMYMSLPNAKVPFRPAAIGAAFTSAVWVIFILLFIVYTKAFAKGTFAVYGTLVAIPLFLLMVYTSSVIILYGAEVAYTLMHPESYRNLKKAFADTNDLNIFNGINILLYVYTKFESGRGASEQKEILSKASNDDMQAGYFMKLFTDNNLIAQNAEGAFYPTKSSEIIEIAEIVDLLHSVSFSIPSSGKKTPMKLWVSQVFADLEKSRKKIIGSVTLKELIAKNA